MCSGLSVVCRLLWLTKLSELDRLIELIGWRKVNIKGVGLRLEDIGRFQTPLSLDD